MAEHMNSSYQLQIIFPQRETMGFPHGCYRKKRPLINNVLLVKIDGPDWYTIYHHRNLLLKGFLQPPLLINQPVGIWDIYAPDVAGSPQRLLKSQELILSPSRRPTQRLQERLLVVGLVAVWIVLR